MKNKFLFIALMLVVAMFGVTHLGYTAFGGGLGSMEQCVDPEHSPNCQRVDGGGCVNVMPGPGIKEPCQVAMGLGASGEICPKGWSKCNKCPAPNGSCQEVKGFNPTCQQTITYVKAKYNYHVNFTKDANYNCNTYCCKGGGGAAEI